MKRLLWQLSALFIFPVTALAQECNPLRIALGQAAGGGADFVARVLAQRMNAKTGQTVIVENKSGAGGNIAAAYVARAPKDGCTLLFRGSDHHVNTMIYSSPGYELKDFVPVTRVVYGALIIVANPQQPLKSLRSVIDYARKNPGKLSYAATAAGSGVHVPMELFLREAGIKILHIPYKGAALSLADVAGGAVPIGIGSLSAAQPFLQGGKLMPLAVLSRGRWHSLPDVPTMTEVGYPEANMPSWLGLFAPAGTPTAMQQKLNQEFRAIIEEPAVRERLLGQGWEAAPSTLQEYARFLQNDERANRKLMDELKLKVE
ncbi:MAG TPA: tripartite tricarboxylate transporter substrate binding protein [Ramlibacter sp.]|nr:tripartite tricarboxylate transporter substrate binding protein [Ramlibacter sp.]